MDFKVTMRGTYDTDGVEMPIGTILNLPDNEPIPANLVNKGVTSEQAALSQDDEIDRALALLATVDPEVLDKKAEPHRATAEATAEATAKAAATDKKAADK